MLISFVQITKKARYNSLKDMNAELVNHRGNEKVSALVTQNHLDVTSALIDDFKPEFFGKLNFYLETGPCDYEDRRTCKKDIWLDS